MAIGRENTVCALATIASALMFWAICTARHHKLTTRVYVCVCVCGGGVCSHHGRDGCGGQRVLDAHGAHPQMKHLRPRVKQRREVHYKCCLACRMEHAAHRERATSCSLQASCPAPCLSSCSSFTLSPPDGAVMPRISRACRTVVSCSCAAGTLRPSAAMHA
jgi:hypothetical protein